MKRIIIFIVAAALLAPLNVFASTWNIDPEHTTVQFKVKHFMISNVKGVFEKVSGTLNIDDKDITKSKVDVSIDVASLNSNLKQRDEHLRSPDFFDAAKYPVMMFSSTKVEQVGTGRLKITGKLTIKGNSKPVVLNVEGLTSEIKDPWGNFRRGASATTSLNRKDFGLLWDQSMDNGGTVVGEDVAIQLEIEFIKK